MIREVTMYAAVCDDCGITPFDEGSDYAAWTDRLGALAEAEGSDWVNPDGDVLYCSTCAAKRSVAEEEAEETAEEQAAPANGPAVAGGWPPDERRSLGIFQLRKPWREKGN